MKLCSYLLLVENIGPSSSCPLCFTWCSRTLPQLPEPTSTFRGSVVVQVTSPALLGLESPTDRSCVLIQGLHPLELHWKTDCGTRLSHFEASFKCSRQMCPSIPEKQRLQRADPSQNKDSLHFKEVLAPVSDK